MVKTLHAAGIEVILDVVYNHTAEGNHQGPMLSLKGFDNAGYYRLVDDDPRYYMDYTGTGNSLNMRNPRVLQLIMDSLRYWVLEMHVDGFRFDLAAALARELHDVDRLAAFFDLIQQDPVVSRVKLIAEPWDIGEGGYQVGNFPPLWSEWNGKYRDTVRDYWRGEPGALGELACRITGSSDLYGTSGRRPHASINFVTAHDGFTLHDLVSYDHKHNEANGEDNRDGESHNRSWNCGAEGPTDDPAGARAARAPEAQLPGDPAPLAGRADAARRRRARPHASAATTTPTARTTRLSWVDWAAADPELLEFAQPRRRAAPEPPRVPPARLVRRPADPRRRARDRLVPRRRRADEGRGLAVGRRARSRVFLNGEAIPHPDARGEPVRDDELLLALQRAARAGALRACRRRLFGKAWVVELDTARRRWSRARSELAAGAKLEVAARSSGAAAAGGLSRGDRAARHLPPAARARARLRAGRGARRLPRRARRQPPVQLAAPAGRARQRARLRRRRSRALERRARRRAGLRASCSTRCASTTSGSCSTSCPTTCPPARPRTAGGGTCSRTARRAARPAFFDVDWRGRRAAPGAPDPAADPGRALRRALREGELRLARDEGAFVLQVASTEAADRAALGRRAAARRGRARRARRCSSSSPTRTAPCRSPRASTRPASSAATAQGGAARAARARSAARSPRRRSRSTPRSAAGTPTPSAARAARAPELPARALARGGAGARLPALLRRLRAGRHCASRTRACSPRRTGSCSSGSRAARSRACASTTWTACATRAATSTGSRSSAPGGVGRGREDPRRGRGAARELAGRRHDRLRLPVALDRPVRRSRGRGRARRALRGAHRRRAQLERGRRATGRRARCAELFAARPRAGSASSRREICEGTVEQRDYTRARARARAGRAARRLAGLPQLRARARHRARAGRTRACVARALRAAQARAPELDPALLDFLGAVLRRALRGPLETELVLRFQQLTSALMAKGVEDTACYALAAARRAQRGRRRPGRVRGLAARLPRRERRGAAALAAHACWRPRRTTPSAARTCARGSRSCPRSPTRWADDGAAAGSRATSATGPPAGPDPKLEYLLYQTLVGAWPISRERAAAYRAEGGARGQGAHQLARARRAPTRTRSRASSTRSTTTAASAASSSAFAGELTGARAGQLAGDAPAQAREPRRARPVPGQRALGSVAGRSRQPPAGRLRGAPRAARRACARRPASR